MKRRFAWLLVLAAVASAAVMVVRSHTRPLPPPSEVTLDGLRAERDALQQKLREVVIANGERSLSQAPKADIMIGIPTTLTRSILEQIVTGLFSETTLTLRNLRVHKEGQVKAKMLFAKRKIGEYVLDVQIHQVQGVLKPGKPALAFGTNTVDLTLPVRVAAGAGHADLHFKWDSKGLASNVVCGDVDITRGITGGMVPQDYEVRGSFAIAAMGETIVLRPQFPDLAVRILVDPSEQAWSVVDGVVRDRSKGCEIALSKVDIKEKLSGILGRGFNVKIPQKIFKPVRLPAGISQSLEIRGIKLALQVKPTGVLVANDRLWYGADVTLSSSKPLPLRGEQGWR